MNLTDLANLARSDKGTTSGQPPHKYTYLYDLVFFEYKERPITLLELGLAVGGPEIGGPVERMVNSPSVDMWLKYFARAQIIGFDISDFSHISHPRFAFFRGDAGRREDLERLAAGFASADIIVDDAAHASHHQQLALSVLWRKLAPGGLYIIEDLHWQPEFERNLPPAPKTAKLITDFFETGTYAESSALPRDVLERVKREAFSFAAFPSFNQWHSPTKLIALRKARAA